MRFSSAGYLHVLPISHLRVMVEVNPTKNHRHQDTFRTVQRRVQNKERNIDGKFILGSTVAHQALLNTKALQRDDKKSEGKVPLESQDSRPMLN